VDGYILSVKVCVPFEVPPDDEATVVSVRANKPQSLTARYTMEYTAV